MRRATSSPRWTWVVLTLLCAGAVVVAVLVVGPESAPASKSRTVTAERGVVQSTFLVLASNVLLVRLIQLLS